MRLAPALAFILLLVPAAQSCARTEPGKLLLARPEGPVLDLADILPPKDELALDSRLRNQFARKGEPIIVASVNSLEGRTIEDFAFQLYNEWGIGDAKTGRGLLLLVAPKDRKVRIEVGCGLEIPITNAVAGKIIRHQALPAFRRGDLKGGTLAAVAELERQLALHPERGSVSMKSCGKAA